MSLVGKYGIRESNRTDYMFAKRPCLIVRETPRQFVYRMVCQDGTLDLVEETSSKTRFLKFVDTIEEFEELNKQNMAFNALCESHEKIQEDFRNKFLRKNIGVNK